MTLSKSTLITTLQSQKSGAISLAAGAISAATYLIEPSPEVPRAAFVAVTVLAILVIFGTRRIAPGIKMTCIQEDQFFEIRDLHFKRHHVYNGFANIKIYVEIPKWMTEFEIDMEPDGPFKLSDWSPGYISNSDNTLVCKNNIDEFEFDLQIIGEADDLGNTTYNLTFKNGKTGQVIESLKLDARREIPRINEDEFTEEEAEEWDVEVSNP